MVVTSEVLCNLCILCLIYFCVSCFQDGPSFILQRSSDCAPSIEAIPR